MKSLFAYRDALKVRAEFERTTLNVVSKKISLSAVRAIQFVYNPFLENTESIR